MAAPRIEDIANKYEQINKNIETIKGQYAQFNAELDAYRAVMESKGVSGGVTYAELLRTIKKQGEYLNILEEAQQKYAKLLRQFTGPKNFIQRKGLYSQLKQIKGEEKSKLVRILRMPAIISFFLGIFLLAFSQANVTGFAIGSKVIEVTTTFILGFIFLVLGAILLLLVLRKQRHEYNPEIKQEKKQKRQKKKSGKKKAKSRK